MRDKTEYYNKKIDCESMTQKNKLSVSLMCADLLNMEDQVRVFEQAGVDYLHIDIMDAHFVPNLTFGPDFVNRLRGITDIPFDIHLLMSHPRVIVRSLDLRPGDIVTVHAECKDNILEDIAYVKQAGAQFGLALNPDTTIKEVGKHLRYVDVLLLMLIVPGFPGSTMINGIMNKVEDVKSYLVKNRYNDILIEVDGSVSLEKAQEMAQKGASIFVGGTASIFKKGKSPEETIPVFLDAIRKQ